MHQDQCVELAREAVVYCGERHDYMPATELLAETFQPHRWVIDAMLLAADVAERERDQYRAGNTELLELLMKLHAGQNESLLPRVRDILMGAGLVNADYTLNWAALEARKPQPKTWEQTVKECVTDPEARARLLAME
jgi:hypothetical protein